MSWAVGYDDNWERDIGYGVPAYCDEPGCQKEIDRGLSYVCCSSEPYGGSNGCGRYFCSQHEAVTYGDDGEDDEPICAHGNDNYISPDHPDWIRHKLTDITWHQWCLENPEKVVQLKQALSDNEEDI